MRLDQIAINSVTTRHDSLADAFAAYAEAGFRLVYRDADFGIYRSEGIPPPPTRPS